MLRALRTSALAHVFRRSIATLLALCVCAAFVEPALADSCDDARRSATVATVRSVLDNFQRVDSNLTIAVTASGSQNDLPVPAPADPANALHVCHCAHAHVAPLSRRDALSEPSYNSARLRRIKSDLTPPSVVQEPQLRPPRTLNVA